MLAVDSCGVSGMVLSSADFVSVGVCCVVLWFIMLVWISVCCGLGCWVWCVFWAGRLVVDLAAARSV